MRNFLSHSFYKLCDRLCNLKMRDGAGDFRMMKRAMVDSILACREYNRYMKGLFSFVGFDTKWIPFHNVERAAGQTKWSFGSLFRYAIDGIFSFSTAPVTLAGIVGGLLLVISLLCGAGLLGQLLLHRHVSGFAAVIFLILLLGGIQLLFISVIGQYVSKDYMENKNRPIYIVKKTGGF